MKNNKIVLSIVVSSLLFSQSYALPSGGKFTHGTSGTINVNGNTMNITGNKVNSVIQWGGGFNIAKGETVNFGQGKTNQNYLNIAYGIKSSTIDGLLNATGNNVYLINPNGVVIGKSGTINANKFGVSTSSIDSKAMQEFADKSTFASPVFSPVFKPNNKGNVINMGNINAKDVLIIGNEVGNVGADGVGNFSSASGGNSSKIQLVGTKVKVNADNIKTDDLLVSAKDQAIVTQSTTGVYKNDKAIIDTALRTTANQNGDYKANFTTIDKSNANKFTALTTISTLEDWAYFAKGINENQEAMQSVDTFDLISDIDFGANCNSEGACTGQNYANFNVAGNSELQNVNMIIGKDYDHAFHANFNGNGYTLSNINIDATQLSQEFQENLNYIGLFGYVKNSGKEMKNLIIDYKYGGIKTNRKDYDYIGGFIGIANGGNFNKIRLSNLGNVSSYNGGIGGLISSTWSANFSNISLSNIKNLSGREVGGGIYDIFNR